jgi:HSP20 family molecular chaperone IbpA
MTARTIVFDSPFLLGFEHTRSLIERAAKSASEGYPPYNVEQGEDGRLRITLAVAGFAPDQLHVTSRTGNSSSPAGARARTGLFASGDCGARVPADVHPRDGMEVEGATLEHGLLHVDVIRPQPETRTKTISIRVAG